MRVLFRWLSVDTTLGLKMTLHFDSLWLEILSI
jgi:hypothetical protein